MLMSRLGASLVILALTISPVAHAAEDMGLTLHNGPNASPSRRAVGAQANVMLKFGDSRTVRDSEKVTLGIVAGPIVSVPTRTSIVGEKRMVTGLAAFKFRPGYSASLDLGGQHLATSYTKLGAAENGEERQDRPKSKQKTGDKVAWVGAVAGGVMVVLAAVALISIKSSSGKE